MPRGEEKENRKEKIFDAAVRCFNEKGYHETTIDTIAAKAKISKGGVYYHFKSKKDLFLELFHYRVNKYFDQIKAYIKEEDNPETRLLMFIYKSSRILKQNEDFFKFCLEFLSMGVREREIRKVMTIFYKDSINTFKHLIEEGIKEGKFRAIDADKTARAVYFLFMGVFFTYYSVNVDFDLVEQHTFQINNILKAIKK